ncbi:NUMOD4 domain-containing protein [Roseibium album]|uniref:NUMOD4 domain-containing protein n=1 Tax=Roseibium album TaxID=311410 RepID=UPI003BB0892B
MMAEAWKDIPGWEGVYQISSFGRVRSLNRKVPAKDGTSRYYKGKVLSCGAGKNGYPVVVLYRSDKRETHTVHRLVAQHFIGPCPLGWQVAHNDGNRGNARLDNLRYDTVAGNASDKVMHGTQTCGEHVPGSKLSEQDVREIRENSEGLSQRELSHRYDISQTVVSNIWSGRSWKHIEVDKPYVAPLPVGSNSSNAKLTEQEVQNILAIGRAETAKSIAGVHGVHPSVISNILNRKTWKHVQPLAQENC